LQREASIDSCSDPYFLVELGFHVWVVLQTAAQKSVAAAFQGWVQALYEIALAAVGLASSLYAYLAAQLSLTAAYQIAAGALLAGTAILCLITDFDARERGAALHET
jgi:hypothetical protein